MKRQPDYNGYKTEEQLKAEARERARLAAAGAAGAPAPSPRKKKLENFWYHYKWQVIIAVAVLAFAGFLLRDLVFRTRPDATVVLVAANALAGEELGALEEALAAWAGDRNGDGKVLLTVDYIQFIPEDTDWTEEEIPVIQADYTTSIKLTTLVAAGVDPLFLLDATAYEYLRSMNGGTAPFIQLDVAGAQGDRLPLDATALADDPALAAFADLGFSVRDGFSSTDQKREYREYCLQLLQALAK